MAFERAFIDLSFEWQNSSVAPKVANYNGSNMWSTDARFFWRNVPKFRDQKHESKNRLHVASCIDLLYNL